MRLSTMKGIAVGSLMGMTVGAGLMMTPARQANETSSEQKWFPFGSPGCRLLDELNNGTPQG